MAGSVHRVSLATLVVGLAAFAMSLGTGIITARMLGPNDRGIFALAAVLPHSIVALVKLGLAQGSIYFIRRDKVSPSLVASMLLVFAAIGSVVALVAMYCLKHEAMMHLLKGAPMVCFFFSMFLVPFLLIESYFFGILQATGDFKVFNRRRLLGSGLTLISMFVALVWWRGGLLMALYVTAGMTILMDAWLVVTVHRICGLRLAWDSQLAGRLLKFGVKSHLQSIATHLNLRTDVYLIAGFLDPSAVAFYSIATRLAELLLFVPESLGTVIYPKQAESGLKTIQDLTATSCRHVLFITALAGILLALIGPWLVVVWYGRAYAPAGLPLYFLVPAVIMMSLFFILSRNFTSQNRQGINILASGVAVGGNVAANLYLIPRWGISGAAVASLGSYWVATSILAYAYVTESGKSLRDLLVIRGSDLQVYARLLRDGWGRLAGAVNGRERIDRPAPQG